MKIICLTNNNASAIISGHLLNILSAYVRSPPPTPLYVIRFDPNQKGVPPRPFLTFVYQTTRIYTMFSNHRRRLRSSTISITKSSLEDTRVSYATVSVRSPENSLEQKIKAISSAGFTGIELEFLDLLGFACRYFNNFIQADDYKRLCEAGREVKKLAASYDLRIVMLRPFANFEGWHKAGYERVAAISRALGWIQIMEAVGTDLLQVSRACFPPRKRS